MPEAASDPDSPRSAVLPNIARIRDHWLNGGRHTDADCAMAQQIELCAPYIPYLVRAQRSLVRRQVRYLIEHGVTQFLDLGSGLPDGEYVHHVAQRANPASRVIYVDCDSSIEADSRALIADADNTAFVVTDCRDVDGVLNHPDVRAQCDLAQPFAVLMTELLLHIPDGEDPDALVAAYSDALPSGGYLAISHFGEDEQVLEGFQIFEKLRFGRFPAVSLRSAERVAEFFTGLDLVDPGVVPLPLWRPRPDDEPVRNPNEVRLYAGLARKR